MPQAPQNGKVGYVYDVRMKYHQDLEYPADPHPEDPRRIYWIFDILKKAGCLGLMKLVPVSPATDTNILRVHTDEYLRFLKETEIMETATLVKTQQRFDSVFLCNESNYCARMSAGGLLALCDAVARGELTSGLAIVRPPGHHACSATAKGFCLLNNVAIAVRDLQARGRARKIMVVDWDVHHGNGIQEAFYSDDSVLYFSIHRHEGGEFYPSSPDGDLDKVGEGKGKGFNINVPWMAPGAGDGDYMYVFRKLLLPVAREFNPDMIIVASGFDAAACDPIGLCNVTPECYACMTSMLKPVSNNKLVLSLEGGYNLNAIANSALGCAKALLNIRWDAGLIPEAAAWVAYATLPEAEVNGVQRSPVKYSPDWNTPGSWDPSVEVPECYLAEPGELFKETVDRVIETQKPHWISLGK
ncbi:Histone deacetylase hda1 [Coemansia sp. RSA 552]|nr:Histone deacetylase hda1 [Coemansia sp. RSA 552]